MEAQSRRNEQIMIALGWLAVAMLVAIPLAVTPAFLDRYRIIKESLSRVHAILGGFGLVAAFAFAGSARFREMLRERALVVVAGCAIVWIAVTTVVSTHRMHSVEGAITFFSCVLIFACAWYAAPRISLRVLDLLVPVVLFNVVLVTLQEYDIYHPFPSNLSSDFPAHLRATGLLGNPNIVGSYMALMAIVFATTAVHSSGMRRIWQAFGAVIATAGAVVSQTRTAVIALIVGMILLAVGRSVKRAVAVVVALALLFGAGIALQLPGITRLLELRDTVAERGVLFAVSGRVLAARATALMIQDHPITGLGPGTFKYHYMPYAIPIVGAEDLPPGIVSVNFGEAHNDHLQILAETGVPGYLLFLAAVIALVRVVRKTQGLDPRERVARGMVVPLAVTLLVLCLALFPLYVPITRHLIVTMAGLLVGWSRTSS